MSAIIAGMSDVGFFDRTSYGAPVDLSEEVAQLPADMTVKQFMKGLVESSDRPVLDEHPGPAQATILGVSELSSALGRFNWGNAEELPLWACIFAARRYPRSFSTFWRAQYHFGPFLDERWGETQIDVTGKLSWEEAFSPAFGEAWVAWLLLVVSKVEVQSDGLVLRSVRDKVRATLRETMEFVSHNDILFDDAVPYIEAGVPLDIIALALGSDVPIDFAKGVEV